MPPVRVAFDLYGTLLDVSGLAARLEPLCGERAPALLAAWRKRQLELTWQVARGEAAFRPFDAVTAEALAAVAPDLPGQTRAQMCATWLTLPAFADAREALDALGAAGVKRLVLSNGTRPMIRAALDAAGLPVDEVLSAADVSTYKTDPRVYALLPREGSLFVSGNAWDAAGARRNGLAVAWIARGPIAPGAGPEVAPDLRVASLAELARAALGLPPPPFWDARYGGQEFIFGTEPNQFLAAQAHRIRPGGRVLSLGEGEGRNAVFLAARGLQVIGTDASEVGLAKARALAGRRGVRIETLAGDLATLPFPRGLDAVVNVFCHLPSALRRQVHRRALESLAPGGLFLAELYRPEQLAMGTGGPGTADNTATLEALREDFAGCEELHAASLERDVVEGTAHTGRAAVAQVVFRKPGPST